MTQIRISETAEKHLMEWLEALMVGEIQLWGLPPSVAAFFYLGEAYGRAARQPEIDQLEREANRWYCFANTTNKQRREYLDQRLAQALETAPNAIWDRIEADLAVMAGRQLHTGVTPLDRADEAQIGTQNGPTSRKAA